MVLPHHPTGTPASCPVPRAPKACAATRRFNATGSLWYIVLKHGPEYLIRVFAQALFESPEAMPVTVLRVQVQVESTHAAVTHWQTFGSVADSEDPDCEPDCDTLWSWG